MPYTTPMPRHYTVEEQKNRLPTYLQEYYETRTLDRIEIDGMVLQGYFEYSFINEKTYVKSPERAADGSIGNLDSYAWFLTPRLVVKYNYMHIEDYRKLMKLLLSKNEFAVTCYDIVLDKRVTHNMYFSTPEMPAIHQRYLEVLGVKNYTVELIGTNTNLKEVTVTYNLNKPELASWSGSTTETETVIENHTLNVGVRFKTGKTENNVDVTEDASQITFNNKYKFKCWCDKQDGTGFRYIQNNEYMFSADTELYAIWEEGLS